MEKNYFGCFSVIFLFFAAGCATLQEGGWLTPPPTVSKYFKTETAGFTINPAASDLDIHYVLTLKAHKPFVRGAFLEVFFENPEAKERPLVMTRMVKPHEKEVEVESSKIRGLKSQEGYVIIVKIYDSDKKKELLGEHRQVVKSIINERLMLDVVGQKSGKAQKAGGAQ